MSSQTEHPPRRSSISAERDFPEQKCKGQVFLFLSAAHHRWIQYSTTPKNWGYTSSRNVSNCSILRESIFSTVSLSKSSFSEVSRIDWRFIFLIVLKQSWRTFSSLYKLANFKIFITLLSVFGSVSRNLIHWFKIPLTWYSSLNLNRCSTLLTGKKQNVVNSNIILKTWESWMNEIELLSTLTRDHKGTLSLLSLLQCGINITFTQVSAVCSGSRPETLVSKSLW